MREHDPKPSVPEPAPPPAAADRAADAGPARRELLRALVDDVDRANSAIASATAERAEAIDRLRVFSESSATSDPHDTSANHGWTPEVCAERELYMELAGVLTVSENTARNLVSESRQLVHELPATLRALHDGAIGFGHARVIADNATSVPAEKTGEFEAALLPSAIELTVPKLRRVANRLRESMYPRSIDEGHIEAVERRTVWIEPADDGMATVGALMTAELAHGIMDRLDAIARSHRLIAGETRSLGQRRADALTDLLLTGDTCAATADDTGTGRPDVGHGIRPRVLVTVPVLTLLGRSQQPGSLDGYGPIDAATARELAAIAPSFTRLLTHPVSSAVLDYDRTTYAVPADLKQIVRLRDGTCRAVGCDRPARRADLDHTDEWHDGGSTSLDNLACLCETHHNVKTYTRVRVENLPGGDIRWTMPSGREYLTRPSTRLDRLGGAGELGGAGQLGEAA